MQEAARKGALTCGWVERREFIHVLTAMTYLWTSERQREWKRGDDGEKNSREYEDVNMCKPERRQTSIRSTLVQEIRMTDPFQMMASYGNGPRGTTDRAHIAAATGEVVVYEWEAERPNWGRESSGVVKGAKVLRQRVNERRVPSKVHIQFVSG